MKTKNIVSIVIALVMLLSVISVAPISVSAATSGDYEYEILDDGTAEITEYSGSATELEIPDTLGGYTVTSIGEYAFSWSENLTSVTIPDSIINISLGAFGYCVSLTSITIPDSVTVIGEWAFECCENLANVTIGNNVTSIGEGAFSSCTSLTSVIIPDSVINLGVGVFSSCTSLESIKIPESVTKIEGAIGAENLKNIEVDEKNTAYSSLDGNLYNKKQTELIQYAAGKADTSFAIPDTVTSIGYCAFEHCNSLISITIPDSVTSIGYNAFSGCENLTSITIPYGVTSIEPGTFNTCSSLTEIKIPDSVTSIGAWAFSGCLNVKKATIGNSVTSIGASAFYGCSNLTSIVIPDSIINIDERAFADCSKLTSVAIGKGITSIGENAFGEYFDNGEYKKADLTIKGYKGTAAERYSKDNGFTFVSLDEIPSTESTTPKLKKNSVNLKAGKTSTITVQNRGNNKVTYKSSNKKVATVKNGKVTALKKGTANITVIVGKTKLTYKVTVTSSPKLNKTAKKLKINGKFTLKVKGKAGTTTFKSNKPKIVSVSKKGVVKAKKKGTAKITVTTNGGVKLNCKITVKQMK